MNTHNHARGVSWGDSQVAHASPNSMKSAVAFRRDARPGRKHHRQPSYRPRKCSPSLIGEEDWLLVLSGRPTLPPGHRTGLAVGRHLFLQRGWRRARRAERSWPVRLLDSRRARSRVSGSQLISPRPPGAKKRSGRVAGGARVAFRGAGLCLGVIRHAGDVEHDALLVADDPGIGAGRHIAPGCQTHGPPLSAGLHWRSLGSARLTRSGFRLARTCA